MLSGKRFLIVTVCIGFAAFIAVAPELFWFFPKTHSAPYNIPWVAGFIGQLSEGDLYPRWLHSYPAGIGAPVFYFYAPLPFYLMASWHLMFPSSGVVETLIYFHWLALLLSGVAFYIWARSISNYLPALFSSVLYIFLPYHLGEAFIRGALGEIMAYVFIPLILLHTNRMIESYRSVAWAAIFYAALIASHLPSALLFSFVWVIYVFVVAAKKNMLQAALRLMLAGLLGAALSAFYVFPALWMRQYMPSDAWVNAAGPHFLPMNNLFFGDVAMNGYIRYVFIVLLVPTAIAILSAIKLKAILQKNSDQRSSISRMQTATVMGALLILGFCWFMMTAPSSVLWLNIDILRQVQFPWRFGAIVDFVGLVPLLALINVRATLLRNQPVWKTRQVIFGIVLLGVVFSGLSLKTVWDRTLEYAQVQSSPRPLALHLEQQGVKPIGEDPHNAFPLEYRSKWITNSDAYLQNLTGDNPFGDKETAHIAYLKGLMSWVEHFETMPPVGLIDASNQHNRITIAKIGAGTFHITAESTGAAQVFIRKAYFPHWVLTDTATGKAIDIVPRKKDGLIGFEIEGGKHDLVLSTRWLLPEIIGMFVSLMALSLFLALILRVKKNDRTS